MSTLSLIGRISLDSTQWKGGLQNLEKGLKPSADRMAGIFNTAFSKNPIFGAIGAGAEAFGFAKVFSFVEEKAEAMFDRLRGILRGTALTGLDADTFQRLANVFTAAGSNPEAIARPMQFLEQALEKVRAGGPEAEKTFIALQKLGLSWKEIAAGDTQAVFLSIFDKLRGAANDAGKLAALKDVFGKGGLELLPAAAIGLGSKAAEGGILSDTERAEMERLKKELAELKAFFRDTGLEAEKMGLRIQAGISNWRNWLPAGGLLGSLLGGVLEGREGEFELTDKARAAITARRKRQAEARAEDEKRDREQFARFQAEQKEAKFNAEIAQKEEMIRQAGLKPGERAAELRSQIALLEPFGREGLGAEKTSQLLDLKLELARLDRRDALSTFKQPTDALRSIGNLLGSDPNSAASRDTLKEIRDILRDIQTKARMRPSSGLVFPTS